MIEISVSSAVLAFLLITVASVLVVWVISGRENRNSTVQKETREHVWRCPICTHVYVRTGRGGMSECPQCGSMNTDGEVDKVDLKE